MINSAFSKRFHGVGLNKSWGVGWGGLASAQRAWAPRGGPGACFPGKCLKCTDPEMQFGAFWAVWKEQNLVNTCNTFLLKCRNKITSKWSSSQPWTTWGRLIVPRSWTLEKYLSKSSLIWFAIPESSWCLFYLISKQQRFCFLSLAVISVIIFVSRLQLHFSPA